MAKKVISTILIVIAFVVTVIVGGYFLGATISIYADLPKCLAQAGEDSQAISKCNTNFGVGLTAVALFSVAIGWPVLGGASLLSIIATILNRTRKDFKWNFRMIFMVICCVLPVVLAAVTYSLLYFNPNNH